MLSRVANSIYWMSRYVERAENVARFIDVNLQLMLDSSSEPHQQQWMPLVSTTGDHEDFEERYGEGTQANDIRLRPFTIAFLEILVIAGRAHQWHPLLLVRLRGAVEHELQVHVNETGDVFSPLDVTAHPINRIGDAAQHDSIIRALSSSSVFVWFAYLAGNFFGDLPGIRRR